MTGVGDRRSRDDLLDDSNVSCVSRQRDFSPAKPDKSYVSDITYIWTSEGWLYLAVVIDLFSRIVVGHPE
jgi:transposase InsO family protein